MSHGLWGALLLPLLVVMSINTGADAAGNAAENNFLPAVAALAAFIVSLTPEELAALSLFMAGGATVVGSSSNKTAITDFFGYLFALKNAEEDSEKTNQNSKEEKNKNSQTGNENPQNNNDDNDGKGKRLGQVRKHHEKKRDEKKQELNDEGCRTCKTEIVFKTKTDKGVVRSRADIVYIENSKIKIGEVKTGKNAKLSEQQKILKEAYKEGNAESTKGKFIKFFKENKEFLEAYQESFKDFKGSGKELNQASKKWVKEQLSNKLDKTDINVFHYLGLFE